MLKHIQYRSLDISYRIEGPATAPSVLLIHGYAEDGGLWEQQLAFLQKKYRVLVPDLPGCGGSSAAPDDITLEDCADTIAALLSVEEISGCTMIGHSMGGYITLAFAERYPDRLQAAGLFHSTAFPDTEEKIANRRKSIEFIRRNGSAPFIRQSTPNLFAETTRNDRPELIAQWIDRYTGFDPASLIAYYEAMIIRPDRAAILRSFTRPFLFIAGQQDNAVPLPSLLHQSYMPSLSFFHILDRAGHMGMIEEPERSNQLLDNFLTNTKIYHE